METPQDRALLEGSEAIIFNLVRKGATAAQWAKWLRVPLEHAAAAGDGDLVNVLLSAGADGRAGWQGCNNRSLLCAAAEGGNEVRKSPKPDRNVHHMYTNIAL